MDSSALRDPWALACLRITRRQGKCKRREGSKAQGGEGRIEN
jgi:hypothetical protein